MNWNSTKIVWTLAGALLACQLVPVWSTDYFPSQDGPSHVYNAWLVANYNTTKSVKEYFAIHPSAAGNLMTQLASIIAIKVLPFAVIDKLIVTALLVCLPLSFLAISKTLYPHARALALLSLLLSPNFFIQMGFWNYCFSVPLLLGSLAFYLNRSDRCWTRMELLSLSGLGALTYATHLLSWMVLACAVGVCEITKWLFVVRTAKEGSAGVMGERRYLPLFSLLPPLALVALYGSGRPLGMQFNSAPIAARIRVLGLAFLRTGTPLDPAFVFVCLIILVSLVLVAVHRRLLLKGAPRETDWLLAMALICALFSLIGPESISAGAYLRIRFSFYAWMFLLLWLGAQGWEQRVGTVSAAVLATIVPLWSAARVPTYKAGSDSLEEYASVKHHIPSNSTVLAVDDGTESDLKIRPLRHGLDLILPVPFIDLGDYEALTGQFLTVFKKNRSPAGYLADSEVLGGSNGDFDVLRYERQTEGVIDYLIFYGKPQPESTWPERKHYRNQLSTFRLVYVSQPAHIARVYQKVRP